MLIERLSIIWVYMFFLPCGTRLKSRPASFTRWIKHRNLMKTYLQSGSKNLFESGVSTCSCDVTGTRQGDVLLTIAVKNLKKHVAAVKKKKKEERGFQLANLRTTSSCHLLCPFRRMFHYILSCVSETICFHLPVPPPLPHQPSCNHPTLTQKLKLA